MRGQLCETAKRVVPARFRGCEGYGDDGPYKGVGLTCAKMKDAEPFAELGASLESVKLPSGSCSLVLGPLTDFAAMFRSNGAAEKIMELLRTQFAETGATHGELKKAFVEAGLGSASSFDRPWRDAREGSRLAEINEGKSKKFKPYDDKVAK